jgi:hypothetical protein
VKTCPSCGSELADINVVDDVIIRKYMCGVVYHEDTRQFDTPICRYTTRLRDTLNKVEAICENGLEIDDGAVPTFANRLLRSIKEK